MKTIIIAIIAIVVMAIIFIYRHRRDAKRESSMPSPKKERKLPNGNVYINGREYLSREASQVLEAAMDAEDDRFSGSKSW